jgi:hypothetical protein
MVHVEPMPRSPATATPGTDVSVTAINVKPGSPRRLIPEFSRVSTNPGRDLAGSVGTRDEPLEATIKEG